MEKIISILREKNIFIGLDADNNLDIEAAKGALTSELVELLKANKPALVSFLKDAAKQASVASIPVVAESEYYAVSPSQFRMFVMSKLEGGTAAYNIPQAIKFKGEMDPLLMQESMNNIVERHEILRTVFVQNDEGEVLQKVMTAAECGFQLEIIDLVDAENADEKLEQGLEETYEYQFDLSTGPLVAARWYRLSATEHVFAFVMHHIISDGWSMAVLEQELVASYIALSSQQTPTLPALNIQYKDYSAWLNKELEGQQLQEHRQYWNDRFAGELPMLDLAESLTRPAYKSFVGTNVGCRFSKEETRGLRSAVAQEGATLFMGLLTAWNLLFYHVTGKDDIVLGSPTAGREHPDLAQQIGFYVNTLAFRTKLDADQSLRELLQTVKLDTIGAYEHQVYPFDQLVEDLNLERDMSRSVLFDVMLVLQNIDIDSDTTQDQNLDIQVESYDHSREISQFDLTLNFSEAEGDLVLDISYSTEILTSEEVDRLISRFRTILKAFEISIDQPIKASKYCSESELQELQSLLPNSIPSYDSKHIGDLFEAQVEATPNAIAVVCGDKEWTFEELNRESNQLANLLLSSDITSGKVVGIALPPSYEFMRATLALFKVGAAYVVIDTTLPQQRMQHILEDADAVAILASESLGSLLADEIEMLNWLDCSKEVFSNFPDENPEIAHSSSDLAYILYTSGTTGVPKGAMIPQGAIANYILWNNEYYFDENESWCFPFFTTPAFDLSVTSMFSGVISGNKTLIPANVNDLAAAFTEIASVDSPVDIIMITPSHISIIEAAGIQELHLKKVILGGEAIKKNHIKSLQKVCPSVLIFNEYGPTETTAGCMVAKIRSADDQIHIGQSINNMAIEVIDANGNPCGIGVAGELRIGGAGMSLGYTNRPELVAEKFIDGTYLNTKVYCSGDLVKIRPDGNIVWLGRIDEQVKINGHRVELAEIEVVLSQLMENADVCVKLHKTSDKADQVLAYYESTNEWNLEEVRARASEILPVYMLPSVLIQVAQFEHTISGKVDKRKLSIPEDLGLNTRKEYIEPRTDVEAALAEIWGAIFKTEVSVLDNFFELGGDSIKAIQIAARMRSRGYNIVVADLLRSPSLEIVATKVSLLEREIDQGLATGTFKLGPMQEQFLTANHQVLNHYNQSVLLDAKESIDMAKLQKALEALVYHHDALRVTFSKESGQWLQTYNAEGTGFQLAEFDLTQVSNPDQELASIAAKMQASIDLENGPLFHVGVFHGQACDRLLLIGHHLVVDGVSWRIVLEDLEQLYGGTEEKLPAKTDSFKRWVGGVEAFAKADKTGTEGAFWTAMLEDDYLPIPIDFQAEENTYGDTESVAISIDEEVTRKLTTSSHKAFSTQINDLLLTAVFLGMGKFFNRNDVAIFLEGHGRDEVLDAVDVSRTIGWFTSMYPVRLSSFDVNNVQRSIIETKELLNSIPNKGIGYTASSMSGMEEISYPNIEQQVVFNYLGEFDTNENNTDTQFQFSGLDKGKDISDSVERTFDLEISGILIQGELNLSISYNSKRYKAETAKGLLGELRAALINIVEVCNATDKAFKTPSDLTSNSLKIDTVMELQKDTVLEDVFPLSPLQEGMYFHALRDSSEAVYFEQSQIDVAGIKSKDDLVECFRLLLVNNPAIRTVFREVEGQVMQVVAGLKDVDVHFENLTDQSEEEQKKHLNNFKEKDRDSYFDMEDGLLIRLSAFQLKDSTYALVWSHHHLLMDGWCVGVLINDFFELYDGIINGTVFNRPKAAPYSLYINWLMNRDRSLAIDFWDKYIANYEQLATLPKQEAPTNDKFEAGEVTLLWDEDRTAAVEALARKVQVTTSVVLQALWGILLAKYNDTRDVMFGMVVSGRPTEVDGIEEMIGLFINTVPLRISYEAETTFEQLLTSVQSQSIESEKYHYLQTSEVPEARGKADVLFDHIMVFENYPWHDEVEEKGAANGVSIENVEVFTRSNYDFLLIAVPGKKMSIELKFNKSCYDESTISEVGNHLNYLMDQILEDVSSSIVSLNCINPEESIGIDKQLDTALPSPFSDSVLDYLNRSVEAHPERTAVQFNGESLTYQQLDQDSSAFAAGLQNSEVAHGDHVVVKLLPSTQLLTTLLGVWKAGAVYVPVDVTWPESRIASICDNVDSKQLIDTKTFDDIAMLDADPSKAELVQKLDTEGVAYIIHTSGTTGKPKGVQVTHGNMAILLGFAEETFGPEPVNMPLLASPSHDLSLFDLTVPMISGGMLIMAEKDQLFDAEKLAIILKDVNLIQTVPARHNQIIQLLGENESLDVLDNVKHIVMGGDAIPTPLLQSLRRTYKHAEIHVMYGPTETTIYSHLISYSTTAVVETMKGDNFGKPLKGHEALVVNQDFNEVPVGVAGEVVIGGFGVAKGYINNDTLNASQFVQHPTRKNEKVYRSGDVAMRISTGDLKFLRRTDNQVKIRGFRIETSEVEAVIIAHEAIERTVVVARDLASGQRELVAFYKADRELAASEIRALVVEHLPAYMAPAFFVSVESWPLNSNGKVDRPKLVIPENFKVTSDIEYVAPESDAEHKLTAIWQKVLGLEKIGVNDNFFELGGDSLKIVRILSAITYEFGLKLQLDKIFNAPTIHQVAKELDALEWLRSGNLAQEEADENDVEYFEL